MDNKRIIECLKGCDGIINPAAIREALITAMEVAQELKGTALGDKLATALVAIGVE